MCKPAVINRRVVRRIIRDSDVTGRDLHRCAVHIVAELGAHPACVSKVEGILEDLVRQELIQLHDAMLRPAPELSQRRGKKSGRRSSWRQDKIIDHLDPIDCEPDPHASVPPAWRGVDPEEYVSTTPPLDPIGGWDDEAVFSDHLKRSSDRHEIIVLAAEQMLDWGNDHGYPMWRDRRAELIGA